MTIEIFLISIFASLIGTAIYACFLSKREDAIRAFIVRSGRGWIRRRYIRLFIHAVRGEATAGDTRYLLFLLLIYPLLVISFGSYLYFRHQKAAHDVDQLIVQVENLKNGEDSASEPLDNIERSLQQDRDQLAFMYPQIVVVVIAGYTWFFWMLFWYQPFVLFRRRFAHELDRFLLRIQGLASKSELAELAQLEARVQNEHSATEYVAKMTSIAKRHNVEHLVDTFLLWGEPTIQDESQQVMSAT